MRGILEFNLPEERADFELAQKAQDISYAASEFDTWLRNEIKYSNKSESENKIYQELRDRFLEYFHGLID